MLVGQAAEGGGFETFPFYKLARLSDEPSQATNAQAGEILRQLGLSEDKLQAVLGLSVKQVATPRHLPPAPAPPECRVSDAQRTPAPCKWQGERQLASVFEHLIGPTPRLYRWWNRCFGTRGCR